MHVHLSSTFASHPHNEQFKNIGISTTLPTTPTWYVYCSTLQSSTLRLATSSTTTTVYLCPTTHLRSYPNYEWWPGAYNAGGRVVVRERAERLTDPEILAEYGDGYYPLRWVYDKGEGGDYA